MLLIQPIDYVDPLPRFPLVNRAGNQKELKSLKDVVTFRIYADGTVIDEDIFAEYDSDLPYYDDYETVVIPTAVADYILDAF